MIGCQASGSARHTTDESISHESIALLTHVVSVVAAASQVASHVSSARPRAALALHSDTAEHSASHLVGSASVPQPIRMKTRHSVLSFMFTLLKWGNGRTYW